MIHYCAVCTLDQRISFECLIGKNSKKAKKLFKKVKKRIAREEFSDIESNRISFTSNKYVVHVYMNDDNLFFYCVSSKGQETNTDYFAFLKSLENNFEYTQQDTFKLKYKIQRTMIEFSDTKKLKKDQRSRETQPLTGDRDYYFSHRSKNINYAQRTVESLLVSKSEPQEDVKDGNKEVNDPNANSRREFRFRYSRRTRITRSTMIKIVLLFSLVGVVSCVTLLIVTWLICGVYPVNTCWDFVKELSF